MSIAQQLAQNRAAFAALAGGESSSQVAANFQETARGDWRLAGDGVRRGTMPSGGEVAGPLPRFPAGGEAPAPLPGGMASVYSLDRPPAVKLTAGESVAPPERERLPVVEDVRFPSSAGEMALPGSSSGEEPLQLLLRRLETDARRNPQLYTEEESL